MKDLKKKKKITKIRAYFNKSKRYQMYYYNMLLIACLPIFTLSKGSILLLIEIIDYFCENFIAIFIIVYIYETFNSNNFLRNLYLINLMNWILDLE